MEKERKRREEQYALEMAIQVKQAEREKKRQELEAEFNAVFEEVNKKRSELSRLEDGIGEMEVRLYVCPGRWSTVIITLPSHDRRIGNGRSVSSTACSEILRNS